MAWFALIVAGLLETFGVGMLNQLAYNRNWRPLTLFILSFGGSLALLSYAMQTIPMGTAYAVWTGIGVVGGTIIGMVLFKESKNWKRIVCIFIIMIAAVGLKLVDS